MSKDIKTRRIVNAISGEVNVVVPTSWSQLNPKELRYIFLLRTQGLPMGEVKRLFFLRKAGMNPVREVMPGVWLAQCGRSQCYVNVRDIALASDKLNWLEEIPSFPVRLPKIQQATAADAVLHGLSFGEYISLQNLHQGFIMSQNENALRDMAAILYQGVDKEKLTDVDLFNINFWFVAVKVFFARKWSDLFSGDGDGGSGTFNPEAAANNMIRSLTGGDVLKENQLLNDVDVWRALTELNFKAKDAANIKKKMK